MLKLLLTQNNAVLKEYELNDGTVRIGRGPENEIRLDDLSVSAKHAKIDVKANLHFKTYKDVRIHDLKSTNGTYINGKKISNLRAKHGDQIGIGCFQLKLMYDHEHLPERTRYYLPDSDE